MQVEAGEEFVGVEIPDCDLSVLVGSVEAGGGDFYVPHWDVFAGLVEVCDFL